MTIDDDSVPIFSKPNIWKNCFIIDRINKERIRVDARAKLKTSQYMSRTQNLHLGVKTFFNFLPC